MQNPEEKKIYSRLLLIILILAVVLALYTISAQKAESKTALSGSSDVLTLNVAPLIPQNVEITKQYIGYVTPINSVNVLPYISGFLDKVYVNGGQEVKKNDKLIMIKQDEYKAKLNSTQANILQAEANYNNARLYYERIKKAGPKAMSKTEMDNAKANYLSTKAMVAQAKADYQVALVNYEYTMINSTIDGIVGNVDLTAGDYVSPASQPLLKIIQYNPIRVVFSITDKDYLEEIARHPAQLFNNESIQIKLSNGGLYEKTGQFKYVDNQINKETNSISVYVDFENENKTLVANAYVDVLLHKTYPDGVLIGQNLVNMESDGNSIYMIRDGKLSKYKVDVIATVDSNYLVANTFKLGDYVVLDKIGRINKDQKIKMHIVDKNGEKK